MGTWKHERLSQEFVRYIDQGVVELSKRLKEEPQLRSQMESVIHEQLSRSQMEAHDIEQGLSILTGPDIAQAVVASLRLLDTHEEIEELRDAGYDEQTVQFLRYLVARYGPVFKAYRRRVHYPLGWHKCSFAVTKPEFGGPYLNMKVMRNDDTSLVLEDDTESMVRLINLMLGALEQVGDHSSIAEETVQEFVERTQKLITHSVESTMGGSKGTEH
ncbi:hypothetical protein CIG75_17370 [Tumebacillus algifaecis]|uniref:Uncharacterized protein n=1 Tax=Tumebacillus algifaecis TaxID=1214604 RepID=A0A223D522_9BACL|nr:hypothetical protein [Tumebacillus algifaecis]ASS76557.1 hypothetical protein CIG75_17370 [Tumebacillus algifaecis]